MREYKDILKSPFIVDMCRMTSNMYRLGWDERNGGNISYMLEEDEVAEYLDINNTLRNITMDFDASYLSGKIFLITGTTKYFKNMEYDPANNLGIIKIASDGKSVDLLWGYEDGGRPTSEMAAHFMSHIERLKVNSSNRVILHTHATNTLAMTFVHTLEEKEFTKTLWRMITECMVVFPDGIGVLPWMLCGTDEIGYKTAEKMREFRIVVWAQHGIFGAGNDLDEAFGLVETVEKSAEIYLKIMDKPILQTITDEQLKIIADGFGNTPKAGYLD